MSRTKSTFLVADLLAPAPVLGGGATLLAADPPGWQVGLKLGRSSLERTFGELERPKGFDDRASATLTRHR